MTTDRIHIRFHRANNRPRVSLIALTLVAAAFAAAPAPSFACGGSDEYIPSKGETSGGGGSDSGSFDVQGLDDKPAAAPTTSTPATTTVTPTGPTQAELDAQARQEEKAREKALQKKREKKAEQLAKKAEKARLAADEARAKADALSAGTGTQTAADVARTAFEDQGAGPLPLVLGILLLVTGVGLVIRYRRTGRSSA